VDSSKNNATGRHIMITGGSQGLGLAMTRAFIERGARVTAIARGVEGLDRAREAGATIIAGDATDAELMTRAVSAGQPDVLILNAGARLASKPIDEQTWEEYSAIWNTDVKAGLAGTQAALYVPMRPGSRVLLMSSGAAMVLSVPYIEPASLWLSGGYVGAKRMVWYMAHQANAVSRKRGLGVEFQVLVPAQLMPGTPLGHAVAAAYARYEGTTAEEHVLRRYGSILDPEHFGKMVAELVGDARYESGVAYGFRADAGIMPLDVPVQPLSKSS